MPRYIIEQDCKVINTWYYAVEAPSLDEAIVKMLSEGLDPIKMESFDGNTVDGNTVTYQDSHEATDEEWKYWNREQDA